jgi:hypothetical protein
MAMPSAAGCAKAPPNIRERSLSAYYPLGDDPGDTWRGRGIRPRRHELPLKGRDFQELLSLQAGSRMRHRAEQATAAAYRSTDRARSDQHAAGRQPGNDGHAAELDRGSLHRQVLAPEVG